MTWRIKNWEKYQHYKDRDPPWIKLHRDTLTSRMWVSLDNDGRALAVACMLIAAGTENQIPDDLGFIKRRGYFDRMPDLSPLVECGFIERCENNDVADASTDASGSEQVPPDDRPETETEAEKRQRREEVESLVAKRDGADEFPEWKKLPQGTRGKTYPEPFLAFYEVFPKRPTQTLKNGYIAWRKALRVREHFQLLYDAEHYAAFIHQTGHEPKLIETWVNCEGWTADLTIRRQATQSEQLQEWARGDGDQGDDRGSDTIDGECLDVSGQGSEGDGDGLLPRAAGFERRGRETGNGRAEQQLAEDDGPEAGGLKDNRRRVAAIAAQAASATAARAQPRGNHAQTQGGHLCGPGDSGLRALGQAPKALDAGGTKSGGGETAGVSPRTRSARTTADELRDIPDFLRREEAG